MSKRTFEINPNKMQGASDGHLKLGLLSQMNCSLLVDCFGTYTVWIPFLNLKNWVFFLPPQHDGRPSPVAVLPSPDLGHHLAVGRGGCHPVLPQHAAQSPPVALWPQVSNCGHQGKDAFQSSINGIHQWSVDSQWLCFVSSGWSEEVGVDGG